MKHLPLILALSACSSTVSQSDLHDATSFAEPVPAFDIEPDFVPDFAALQYAIAREALQ